MFLRSFASLVLWGIAPTMLLAQDGKVASIEAFLVYGQSGKLSANIAPPSQEIGFWNTMIGEGGAGEWTEDVLIVAHIDKDGDDVVGATISLRAQDHDSRKILLDRTADVVFAKGKIGSKAVLLEAVHCTNVDVTVTVGNDSKTINLPFACGE